jgi:hypothetical protein
VVPVELKQVQGQSAQCGEDSCPGSSIAVVILTQLGVPEPVPAFDAPSLPHQLQQGFWRGAQAGQKEVPLEERLACTLAADDKLENPAAAWPVLGDAIRSRSGPECPGGVAPVTAL